MKEVRILRLPVLGLILEEAEARARALLLGARARAVEAERVAGCLVALVVGSLTIGKHSGEPGGSHTRSR